VSIGDAANNKGYRRGLVLGLTMAEIMILVIFLLLMALGAALGAREKTLALYQTGEVSQLVERLQRAYPEAANSEDFFKELTRAVDVRQEVEEQGLKNTSNQMIEDAEMGRRARVAAEQAGIEDPSAYIAEAFAANEGGRPGRWPPFLSLSEAGGYYFDSGRATLRPEFERNLVSDVIPMLERYAREYDVDVIEVIGHTDEVPMAGQSNLDSRLIAASTGRAAISDLQSTDNAGLAMARAVAVVRELRADQRLANVTILPLSGAQMVIPVDRMADGSAQGDDQRRRRIEIRLRKSTAQATAPSVE